MGNLVSQLMRIQKLEPINTVQDLVERNITIVAKDFLLKGQKDIFLSVNTYDWVHIANTMVSADYGCFRVQMFNLDECAELPGKYEFFIREEVNKIFKKKLNGSRC